MDKGGMCEKRGGEDSEEGDEKKKSWTAGFWLIWLFIQLNKNSHQLFKSQSEMRKKKKKT